MTPFLLANKEMYLLFNTGKQDLLYMDNNLDASILVLRKVYGEWKEYFVKHNNCDPLRVTL